MRSTPIKLIAIVAALGLLQADLPAADGKSAPGPIFTLPKTLVQVDLVVEKSIQTPGAYCEFIDLFLPGMEPDVACNSKLLPPTDGAPDSECELSSWVFNKDDESDKGIESRLEQARKKSRSDSDQVASALRDSRAKLQKRAADKAELDSKRNTLSREIEELESKASGLQNNLEKTDKKNKGPKGKFDRTFASQHPKLDEARQGWTTEKAKTESEVSAKRKELNSLPKDATVDKQLQSDIADFAAKLDKLDAVAQEHSRQGPKPFSRTSIKSYSVSTSGVPDPRYLGSLDTKSGFFIDSTQSLELTPSGIITGLESDVANRKGEFFMSLVKAAAGIFGRIATGGGLKAIDPGTDLQLQSLQTDVQKFEEEFLLEGRKESGKPEEIATAESLRLLDNFRMLSKCRAKQYAWAWKHQNVFRSAINTLRLARRSYRSIGDYADSVKTVLTGGPGPSLQVALDAVSKRYTDALAADFLGLRQSLSWTPSYQLEPERGHESLSKVVFQIASCGVKINSEVKPFKNPAPGGIRCAPIKEGQPEPDFREVALTVSRRSNELISRAEKLFPEYDKAGNGLAFIVPGQATVSVSNSGIELTDPVIDIAQWGFATRLPDGLVDKDNGGIKVSYYEATGALKSIKVVSKARLNSSMVDNVAGSVMTALDAKLKADAEEAKKAKADADELLQLQRQRQILEEKKKIKEACDFLKISCEN